MEFAIRPGNLPDPIPNLRSMFRRLIFLLPITCAVTAAGAEQGHFLRLTLGKAISMALEKNFSIAVQKFDPKVAAERERAAEGRFDPAFGIGYLRSEGVVGQDFGLNALGQFNRFSVNSINQTSVWSTGVTGVTIWGLGYDVSLTTRNVTGTASRFNDRFSSEAAFSLRQPLLRGAGPAANLAGVRIARNNVTISEWSVKEQVMAVITQVVEVFNELQFARENLDVARRSRELAMQLLRDNIKRVEIGVKTPLDVTTAQAEAAAREVAVIATTRVVKDQENFLKQLITADLIPLLNTRVEIAQPPAPGFQTNVMLGIKDALELRPDYRQMKLDIENKHIRLAFAKNDQLPRLDLIGSLNLLGLDDDFGSSLGRVPSRDQSGWSVGASFSIPIGRREGRGQYNAAKLESAQALVRLQQLEQEIIVQVDNANGAVITAQQEVAATAEARRLARESLAAGEARLVAGTGTTFEVLELQKKLAETESAEFRSRANYNKAVARYRRETGTTLRVHAVKVE